MNSQCSVCSFFPGDCPPDTYMATECTHHTNRVCSPCRKQCPAGQYMASPCNATHDAVCLNCSSVQKLNCSARHPAPASWYVVSCSAMTDAACAPCSPACVAGQAFEARNCSGNHDRICIACTQCLSNTFEASPCTPKSDRICSVCDSGACPSGTWESSSCKQPDPVTGLMLNKCTACSFPTGCDPYNAFNPTYEATPCTGSATDVVATDRLCKPCTQVCEDGKHMDMPCAWNRDAVCTDYASFDAYSDAVEMQKRSQKESIMIQDVCSNSNASQQEKLLLCGGGRNQGKVHATCSQFHF